MKPHNVFISYSHKDEFFCIELKKHLSSLERQGVVSAWYDREITPGANWNDEIMSKLENSSIILLLISSDFISSNYCYDIEVKRSLELHKIGVATVIPIIVRPANWIDTPLANLLALPKDGKAISLWENSDEAYLDIVNGIKKIVNQTTSVPNLTGNEIKSFPYDSWTSVNEINWSENLVAWFEENFYNNQLNTTEQLLRYVALIIKNSTPDSRSLTKVMELGKIIIEKVKKSGLKPDSQFIRILELLSLGLHHQHSHLFAVPKVYISNLINIPDYSSILLATKYHGLGNYQESIDLLGSLTPNCPLANYIVGQSYRKIGKYNLAESHLSDGLRDTNLWSEHNCPYNKDFAVLCNGSLLKSSILRAAAVIKRKQKQNDIAEANYIEAERILEVEIENNKAPSAIAEINSDDLQTTYNIPNLNKVLADIYFSHGYYWYENNHFDQGKLYFKKSIVALERSNEDWDSPYTRLAIIELVNGNYEDATKLFTKAYIICSKTPIQKNREASISKALCTLGLTVLETVNPSAGQLTTSTPIVDLKLAMNQKPSLTLGPLECHRDDAKHILRKFSNTSSTKQIIEEFIYVIEKEIRAAQK